MTKMHSPRISIVTPSLNQGTFLEHTICSVLDQGYPNLEYIIIDGGSDDNSREIIKKYEKHLSFWCSEPDAGHYAAVNKGFTQATGEIFAWLNSDDMYCPWALESVASVFSQFQDVQWLTTLVPLLWDSEGMCFSTDSAPGFAKRAFLNGSNIPYDGPFTIQQESTFWRRSLWDNVGGLNLEYQLAADFDLWSQFYLQTDLYGLNSPLAGFRVHKNQRSHQVETYREEARQSLAVMRAKLGWKEKIRPMQQLEEYNNRYLNLLNKAYRRLTANKNIGKNINRVVQPNENIWRIEEVAFFE